MFSVRVQKGSFGRVLIWRDIRGTNINEVTKKVLDRVIFIAEKDDPISKLSYLDVTEDNAVELAKQYDYTITDVTAEYAPQHTIIGGKN